LKTRLNPRRAPFRGRCFPAAAGVLLVLLASSPGQARPVAVTRTEAGIVAGKHLPSGVTAYLGLPYAAPPVRALRWRPPAPVRPWDGVFNADRFAPECIQNLRAKEINHYFGEEATSEDCLYLNVWTPPGAKADQARPVIVWIYGGAFSVGSSAMANYGGEALAGKGAIYVSFNYRLGALGFMAHPDLAAEDAHHASGAYGYLDQIAALAWVQRNIARFGGDPKRVTIMGQSAGSISVFDLQASPLAKGLFHRVVGMSGGPGLAAPGAGGADLLSRAQAEAVGLRLQAALKAPTLAEMRRLPADRILAAQNDCQAGRCEGGGPALPWPSIDGHVLPDAPLRLFAEGRQSDVPTLVGFTHDESWTPLRATTDLAGYRETARKLYGDRAEAFLALYPATTDAQAAVMARTAARDGGMASVMRRWARAQAATGKASVYVYGFARPHPYTPGITFADLDPATAGAYHTSEVPYFLQTLDSLNLFRRTRDWKAEDRRLSDTLADSLIAFAATGDPSTAAAPWPAYDLADERLVTIGAVLTPDRFDPVRMDFMDRVRTPFSIGAPPRAAQGSRD